MRYSPCIEYDYNTDSRADMSEDEEGLYHTRADYLALQAERDRLAGELARVRAALKIAEWGDFDDCPTCNANKGDGHRDGCTTAQALSTTSAAKGDAT
jgi:hypothetical protein